MTSTYSISNIIHIYDDLVNQKMTVSTSLPQSRINFLDSFITAVFRVIGGAWFDRISVSRITPQSDVQGSKGIENLLTLGQENSNIVLESSITHFVMNNARKSIFYAASENYVSQPNVPISVTLFINWQTEEDLTALDTLYLKAKILITDSKFNNASKEITLLLNPNITNNLQYFIVKEHDISSGKVLINNIELAATSTTQVAINMSWELKGESNASQAIIELEITSRTTLGVLNVTTDNIEPPPELDYEIPNDPDVFIIGAPTAHLYVQGVNTSLKMNSVQRNISFMKSVNYLYQTNMRIGAYIEWDNYLINQSLHSFNIDFRVQIVDNGFNTSFKEVSIIVNPDLTTNIEYLIINENEVVSKSYQIIGIFLEKINYRQILIYMRWIMLTDEIECQSVLDLTVLSKTTLGNIVITGYSA